MTDALEKLREVVERADIDARANPGWWNAFSLKADAEKRIFRFIADPGAVETLADIIYPVAEMDYDVAERCALAVLELLAAKGMGV